MIIDHWSYINASVNTVYRTDDSDSFAFKFLDGFCSTVIEVSPIYNCYNCTQSWKVTRCPTWRWSLWWPSMAPGALASGTLEQGLRTSRTDLIVFHLRMLCLHTAQVPHPSQRRHCLGPGPRRLYHRVCLTVRHSCICQVCRKWASLKLVNFRL